MGCCLEAAKLFGRKSSGAGLGVMRGTEWNQTFGSVVAFNMPLRIKVMVFEERRATARYRAAESHFLPKGSAN